MALTKEMMREFPPTTATIFQTDNMKILTKDQMKFKYLANVKIKYLDKDQNFFSFSRN